MTSITPISATDFSTYDGGNYQAMRGIASSFDGSIIYVSMNGVTGIGVMKSSDHGNTWEVVYNPGKGFTSIACSSDGNIVYAANLGDGLYKSTNAGTSWNRISWSDNTLPGGSQNPENTDTHFGGYKLNNIYQIACDSTGTKLIMTTNAAASIYRSTNSGVTWSFVYAIPGYSTNPISPTTIASNADGTILYSALNNTTNKNIIVSKDSGLTWTSINMLDVSGTKFNTLGTNSYGDFVFCVDDTSKLNVFYPTHIDKALLVPSAGNTLVALSSYNNGNNLIISQNNYQSITNGVVVLYSLVNKYSPGEGPATCFKHDSNILCFKDDKELYVKVQDIRKGDLVKTLKHGYVPVDMIGKKEMEHPAFKERVKDQLYKCSKDNFEDVFEDLIITGCHSILVDSFTNNEQKEKVIEINGNTYITDNKYRLPVCADLRASIYEISGTYTIYHLALENSDYYMNYGIYANGLLVETCSKRYLKELSNMDLIE